jgi:hypothetical protein
MAFFEAEFLNSKEAVTSISVAQKSYYISSFSVQD